VELFSIDVSSHISNTQSVISYDRGGKWQLLHGPDEECRQLGEVGQMSLVDIFAYKDIKGKVNILT
jgi:hypothetical protein